jgi:hypothetical protein
VTEDHAYQPGGAFGRCLTCNRRKTSHEAELLPGAETEGLVLTPMAIPPGVTFGPVPGPGVSEVLDLQRRMNGLPVVDRRKLGKLGSGSKDFEATWPDGWRLPQIGESLFVADSMGRVTDVRFNLDRGQIIISIE